MHHANYQGKKGLSPCSRGQGVLQGLFFECLVHQDFSRVQMQTEILLTSLGAYCVPGTGQSQCMSSCHLVITSLYLHLSETLIWLRHGDIRLCKQFLPSHCGSDPHSLIFFHPCCLIINGVSLCGGAQSCSAYRHLEPPALWKTLGIDFYSSI